MASPPLLIHIHFLLWISITVAQPTHLLWPCLPYLLTPLFPGSPHFLNCRVPPVGVPQEQHPIGETSEDALNAGFDNRVLFSLRQRSLHCPDARPVGTLGWTHRYTSTSISPLQAFLSNHSTCLLGNPSTKKPIRNHPSRHQYIFVLN